MHHLILWCAFAGAWLLVAGPLWQAVVELSEEDFERERYQDMFDSFSPPQVSAWWWLLPPVHFLLRSRRKSRWQAEFMAALPDSDFEALSSYFSKARGWMLVGTGGLLIAVRETSDLVEGYDRGSWVFGVVVAGMALLTAGSAALQAAGRNRMARHRSELRQARTGPQ